MKYESIQWVGSYNAAIILFYLLFVQILIWALEEGVSGNCNWGFYFLREWGFGLCSSKRGLFIEDISVIDFIVVI